MNIKKITAFAAAAIMAAGICTGVPVGTENVSPLAITAEAADSESYKPTLTMYDDNTVDVTWDAVDGAYYYRIYIDLCEQDGRTVDSSYVDVAPGAKKDFKSGENSVKAIPERKYTVDLSAMPRFGGVAICVAPVDKNNKIMETSGYAIADYWSEIHKRSAAATSSKVAAPTGFKATKTNSSITLSWGAVEGADMYRVYMYNEKTGKYEKYKDVKSAKCAITGLSANTKYKFKVTAYDKVDGKYV
ncbi:MAG: fibronectin type III domain-containing protein, partial [Muribaculaceae bacterium]|nr:fibronectin type III domain-containing protein [Muribaculaceae bacterium]